MEVNPTQTPVVQSLEERDDSTTDKLCDKLKQLRYSHLLPTELLLCIVECLRLPVQDVTSVLPPPEFLVNRKTLYNLCLSSRDLYDIARPLLYRTVIFFIDSRDYDDHRRAVTYGGLKNLILLVRTLLSKDEYCKYIENIICPASLKPHDWALEEDIELEVSPKIRNLICSWPPNDDLSDRQKFIMNSARLDRPNILMLPIAYISTLSLRFLAALICLSYNLRLLLRWTESSRYLTLDYILRQALKDNRYSILPQSLSVYIQQLDFSRLISGSAMEIASEFLEFGKIHRLHVWRDHGYITFPVDRDYSWIGRIRELKLVTYVDAEALFRIFESAVNLESFSLVVAKSHEIHRPPPPTGKDLNHALVKLAGTLKVLELRTCHNTWFLSQLGRSKVLDCLPQLKKLETLTTEIPLITSIQTSTRDTSILEKLPPNLISLEAVEMWWRLESGFSQNQGFMMALSAAFAAELQRGLLPSLKHVRYIPGVVECHLGSQQLDAIKILFDKTHVSFSHKAESLPKRFFHGRG